MNKLWLVPLLGSAAALAACATVPAAAPVAAASGVCGTYGYVDINNDGFISGDEWNTFHTRTYADWDVNRDGRVNFRDTRVILAAVERVETRYPDLIGGTGLYHSTGSHGPFAHIDVRGSRARWSNNVRVARRHHVKKSTKNRKVAKK